MIPGALNHMMLQQLIPSGYLARYTFDNIGGATVYDESSNNNDATLVNSPSIASGYRGNSYYGGSTNERLDLPGGLLRGVGDVWAVTAVCKKTSTAGCFVATAGDTDGSHYFWIVYSSDSDVVRVQANNGDGTYQYDTDATFSDDEWLRLTIQMDETIDLNPEIWVGGVKQPCSVISGVYPSGNFGCSANIDNDVIGAAIRSTSYFSAGGVDNWMLYDRKLAPAEIRGME